MGLISRLRKVRIELGGSSLHHDGGPEQAAARAAEEHATRPLYGPAGHQLYGPGPDADPGPPPPPPAPPVSADPAAQHHHELATRDAARAAYLAPERAPVVITRIPTRGRDALTDVVQHLAASGLAGRADLVYGVYRVPDHIGTPATSQARRYEEWDIVHAATTTLPAAPLPGAVHLDARQQWVARASGQPSVLDEDLGIALLQAAGVAPEQVLGVARHLATRAGSNKSSRGLFVDMAVTGVDVLWAGPADLPAALASLAAAAPVELPIGPPPGVHLEVMNWVAIAKAVAPRTGAPHLVPSPFPYLPSTPQELLRAHLEIVGIRPADCCTAQVTIDVAKDVSDKEKVGPLTSSTNRGQSQPCVDGKDRPRLSGAARVVVGYRDRPEYAAGRERWAAYERDVLQAQLHQRTGTRRPVEPMDMGSLAPSLRGALRAVGAVASVAGAVAGWAPNDDGPFEAIPDARYCWPPTDAR